MPLKQANVANRLLARLNSEDFDALAARLEPVRLPRSMVFAAPNEPITHAYFLEDGVASIVTMAGKDKQAEAGLVGREGFVHPVLALGTDRVPQLIQMQIAGAGHRIARDAFIEAIDGSASLRALMLLYTQALGVQSSFTSLANAVHSVDERLARWLLMRHDRSDSDDLELTHGFMSTMLSVRRPSVTTAIHVLVGKGLIEADRGFVTVRNRAALEAFAAGAYGPSETEYRRLLGPM